MYVGCTYTGMHYLGLYLSYVTEQKKVENGRTCVTSPVEQTLISVSPMAQIASSTDSDERVAKEATEFNAKTHVKQIREIFQIFGLDTET